MFWQSGLFVFVLKHIFKLYHVEFSRYKKRYAYISNYIYCDPFAAIFKERKIEEKAQTSQKGI